MLAQYIPLGVPHQGACLRPTSTHSRMTQHRLPRVIPRKKRPVPQDKRPVIVLSLAMIGALAIVAWLLIARPWSTVSAAQLLTEAEEKNTTVETYKYTMDAWQTPQVEGDPPRYETVTEAVVVFDEGVHFVIRGNGSYSESLLLQGRQYRRDSADGVWEESPSSFDSSRMVTLDSTEHFQMIDDLIDATVVGEETLDGVRVRKITGRVDLQQKAEEIWGGQEANPGSEDPRQQMLAGTEEFVAWVGIEDGLIHALEVSGSYPAAGELLAFQLWYRVRFSEFDEDLELPSVE